MRTKITMREWLSIWCLAGMVSLTSCGTSGKLLSDGSVDLTCDGSMELAYATEFSVDYYGDYRLITIKGDQSYLVVPEGEELSEEAKQNLLKSFTLASSDRTVDNLTVLQQPMDNIYLVSTSVMDFFICLDGLDHIRLSGTRENSWYLDEAIEAMEQGSILYAGKYSAPDYEMILEQNCDLAMENTMIYHNPEVKEQLENLGIPVMVEHSSYEAHPLGRLEWIKLYGVLLGKEAEATEQYESWLKELEPVMEMENTGQTVAFFYITKNKTVNIRKTNDYIAKMIELAGGNYIFSYLDQEEENALSTMNIDMEEFYSTAKDADYLIYNCTIDEELHSLDELLQKNALLADFKAVREGKVYCTGKNFFQETTGMEQFIRELHEILEGEGEGTLFLKRLE